MFFFVHDGGGQATTTKALQVDKGNTNPKHYKPLNVKL